MKRQVGNRCMPFAGRKPRRDLRAELNVEVVLYEEQDSAFAVSTDGDLYGLESSATEFTQRLLRRAKCGKEGGRGSMAIMKKTRPHGNLCEAPADQLLSHVPCSHHAPP